MIQITELWVLLKMNIMVHFSQRVNLRIDEYAFHICKGLWSNSTSSFKYIQQYLISPCIRKKKVKFSIRKRGNMRWLLRCKLLNTILPKFRWFYNIGWRAAIMYAIKAEKNEIRRVMASYKWNRREKLRQIMYIRKDAIGNCCIVSIPKVFR